MNFRQFSQRLIAVAVFATAGIANAGTIDARFNGTVSDQTNSGFAVGSAIAGEFVYDTNAQRYLSFNVGGLTVAPGYASTASITPDLFTAIYRAQVSPVPGGGSNSTFIVDLEGINRWPSNNAIALLLNASVLATNLDTTFSTFGFFIGDAAGTNIRSLNAALSTIRITAVPEPGSIALVVIGLTALGVGRARRAKR